MDGSMKYKEVVQAGPLFQEGISLVVALALLLCSIKSLLSVFHLQKRERTRGDVCWGGGGLETNIIKA